MESTEKGAGHNISADIRALIILHTAMLIGQVLFCAIAAFMVLQVGMPHTIDDVQPLRIGVGILALGAIIGSQALYGAQMAKVAQQQTREEKLAGIRKAVLLRNALLEAPALLAIILFMLSGGLVYLGITSALIIWFALQYPTRSRILSAAPPDDLWSSGPSKGDRF
jgi:hypothetical protein